jgi:hypothetical protein
MRLFGLMAVALTLVCFCGLADARVKLKDACGADLEKFCKDVKKGDGRKACLRTHASDLQPSCTDALKERDAEKAAKKPS